MGALFSMIERKGRKVNENINILVAEDDPDINRLIGKILRNAGYEVISAFSGTEAATCLEMKAFDLLLLDLMMPGMDGERLLTELREKKGMNTPVLILSAKAALADKVRLLTEGADDYMTKPFEPEELLARVGAILRRSHKKEEKADEVLKHKNLRLYPASHQIRVCGQEISLTKHEFELLHVMLQSPGKVFSREMLYEQVWQGGYYGEDNSVNVHISNIRKKISAVDQTTEYIKTVWGIGFKISE